MSSGSRTSAVESVWAELYEETPALVEVADAIAASYELLRDSLRNGRQLLICGNGGSASDSEHIAGELAKPCAQARPLTRQQRDALLAAGDDGYLSENLQQGLPVWPLVSQAALITAIANDQGGDLIFAQQVMAYGRPGDVLWALSTSGNSANIIHALRAAASLGLKTLGFSGTADNEMSMICDVVVGLPGSNVPAIQHSHQLVYHAICLALEAEWYST